jgi:hypothetical protein
MTNNRSSSGINAFHPDYMKTYHPNFMTEFRTIEANQIERAAQAPRKRVRLPAVKKESTHVRSKANQRMTMAEVKAEMLKVTTFHVYSKAGY